MPFGERNDTATTRFRRTRLILDPAEWVMVQPAWGAGRYIHEIAKATQIGVGSSENVKISASGDWTLKPVQDDLGRFRELESAQPNIQKLASWTTFPGHVEEPTWRAPTSLPGVTVAAGTAVSGDHFIHRRIPAGQPWGGVELAYDITPENLPKPELPNENIPMRRMAIGNVVHPADTGFMFRIKGRSAPTQVPGPMVNIYFGGPTGPPDQLGGLFSLALFGSGAAELRERIIQGGAAVWNVVSNFFVGGPNMMSVQPPTVAVQPTGNGNMNFYVTGGERGNPLGRFQAAPAYSPPVVSNFTVVQRYSPVVNRGVLRANTTGPGRMRLDYRESDRPKWQVSTLVYPAEGVIEDHYFMAPFPMAGNKEIVLKLRASNIKEDNTARGWPSGNYAVEGVIHDGDSRAPLNPSGAGHSPEKLTWRYLANSGQMKYFIRIKLKDDTKHTPLVSAWEVEVGPTLIYRTGLQISVDLHHGVSITGPAEKMDHESASLQHEDLSGVLSGGILAHRARIHCYVDTEYDEVDPEKRVKLFEGEVTSADSERSGMLGYEGMSGGGISRGDAGKIQFPHPEWKSFRLECQGLWTRLVDQLNFVRKSFAVDEQVPRDPNTGKFQAWKITDIIKWVLLNAAGWPSTQLDIPDNPIRLLAIENPEDYILNPTANPFDYVTRLARDYLAQYLLMDINALGGPTLRLRKPTPLNGPFVNQWSFQLDAPTLIPGVYTGVNFETSYPDRTTFIQRGFCRSRIQAPEFNYCAVTASGQTLPNQGGSFSIFDFEINSASYDFFPDKPTADENHPDFLGRFVPVVVYDPMLGSSQNVQSARFNVRAFTRRLMDFGGHAIKWLYFMAPLPVFEPLPPSGDPLYPPGQVRILRHDDPVLINGLQAIIYDCNPRYEQDDHQMAIYSAKFI